MKKINKININGESYDIQDNSSGYITGEEVDKFLPKGYVITTQVNTKENQETASKIWEDIKNGKPVEVWYQWATSEYRRMIGYRFFETSYQLDMYFERDSFTTTYPKDEVDLTATYAVEITYHHSDNIYNRVLILANRQAFLIKNSSVNIATRNYVDTKFAEAIAMGFKVEVVEALPTENISHQVIYLVLNGDDEENNIYDEFVYNSNDEWEKIGSTKTDLSNYYNKQEVDEKIKPLEVLTLEPIVNNSSISVSVGKDAYPKLTDDNKTKIIDGVNKLLNSDFQYAHLPFYFYPRGYPLLIDILLDKDKILTDKNINTNHNVLGGDNTNTQYNFWFNINFSMEDNVVTAIKSSNISARVNQISITNNVHRYDITNDYNPAHKFYVDTSVVYDWVNNNIRYWQSSVSYLVGDIVYASSHSKYYKCLTEHKSSSSISFDIDNWQELTEEDLEAFKRPTKEYVDDSAITKIVIDLKLTEEEIIAQLQELYNTYLAGKKYICKIINTYGSTVADVTISGLNNIRFELAWVMNQSGTTNTRYGIPYYVQRNYTLYVYFDENNAITSYNLNNYYRGNVICSAGKDFTGELPLGINNTSEYTPTKGSYNPATAKYVDDSISTALGDVNSILATLTTVEESEVSE